MVGLLRILHDSHLTSDLQATPAPAELDVTCLNGNSAGLSSCLADSFGEYEYLDFSFLEYELQFIDEYEYLSFANLEYETGQEIEGFLAILCPAAEDLITSQSFVLRENVKHHVKKISRLFVKSFSLSIWIAESEIFAL